MTTTITIHDSTTCQANAGQPCDFCNAAIEFEQRQVPERVRRAMIEDDHEHDYQTVEGQSVPQCECGAVYDYEGDRTALPSFDDDWELAPLSMTRTTERECAEYWYQMGQQAKEREMLLQQNSDLREILRVGNERITR